MHIACTAAKVAPGKLGPGGKGVPAAGAPPPPVKASASAAAAPAAAGAAAAARKGGKGASAGAAGVAAAEAAHAVQVSQADEDSALASLQWVMSSRPDATVAGQQLKDAWARVRRGHLPASAVSSHSQWRAPLHGSKVQYVMKPYMRVALACTNRGR